MKGFRKMSISHGKVTSLKAMENKRRLYKFFVFNFFLSFFELKRKSQYLIVPELSDFLMLHGRVIPDEIGHLIIISGFMKDHLLNDNTNCK